MPGEFLKNAELAEIVFNDAIIDMTQGEYAGKVTAQNCLEVLKDRI